MSVRVRVRVCACRPASVTFRNSCLLFARLFGIFGASHGPPPGVCMSMSVSILTTGGIPACGLAREQVILRRHSYEKDLTSDL